MGLEGGWGCDRIGAGVNAMGGPVRGAGGTAGFWERWNPIAGGPYDDGRGGGGGLTSSLGLNAGACDPTTGPDEKGGGGN